MEKKRRALILYATMTKNTEKIATAFQQTFLHYGWDVTMYRLYAKSNWAEMQPNCYFDDYDVVCLGSPIVAGGPLTIITKLFSLGGGSGLETQIQSVVDSGEKKFTEKAEGDTMKNKGPGAPKAGQAGARPGCRWRRNEAPYRGIQTTGEHEPLGIVFTTYGGGFCGSQEALATLEILKLYLKMNNVITMGKFACCGKEFGPAGLDAGEKPRCNPGFQVEDPKLYALPDGTTEQGSFFFHHNMWDKPSPRDTMKAQALIADFVEDYFLTNDGEVRPYGSEYISIS